MNKVALVAIALMIPVVLVAQTNVLMQHNDIGRTGQNLTETILAPSNVSSGNFGLLSSLPIDGPAFAQTLYVSSLNIGGVTHSVVFVATENDSVYAYDAAAAGQLLWKANLADTAHGAATGAIPDPESDTGCANANGPEFGITGTPVIDATTNTMYVVSKTYENNYPVQRLHALDITTGNEKFAGPATIQAKVTGTGVGSVNGQLAFDPKWENQRAGLLLLNGSVYIAWASHCDYGPWHGWVMSYNASTLTQTAAFVTTPNGGGSGVWMSGAGLAADNENGVGRMFVATGNGTYDATTPYGTNTMDYGDDIVSLNLGSGIKVADAFTPNNQLTLQQQDMDVSAGGVVVLPDNMPGASVTHEAVQMSKAGVITVLNRDNLGGYNSTDQVLQEFNPTAGLGSGLWGMPAYWNGNLYVWPSHALPSYNLLQYKFTDGLLSTSPTAVSTVTDSWNNGQFLGASPSISANQTSGGILWVADTGNNLGGAPQYFYALDATNVANTLWSSAANPRDSAGIEQHFSFPTIADGRVFLPSLGNLLVYGLLDFSMTAPSSVAVDPGNNTVVPIGLSSANSFTQGVSFSASGLPAGVTVSFAATPSGSENAIFTAASNATAGTSTVTILATRGTTSRSAIMSLTVGGLADFAVSATAATVSIGTTGYGAIAVTSTNGFSGTPTYSAVSLPAGIAAQFVGCSSGGCTMLLTASPTINPGSYAVTLQASFGALTHFVSTTVTVAAPTTTSVNLASNYNVAAIATNGTSPVSGGLDGGGYAFSGNLLGSSLFWAGTTFILGPANQLDAVSGQTITLPAGNYVNLKILASGGGGLLLPIVVNYTDGTTTTFTQSFSNWGGTNFGLSNNYAGESVASTSAYRVIPGGTTQNGPWYVYGYAYPLNSGKTVSSVTLPPSGSVVVMAMALSSVSSTAQTVVFSPIAAQPLGGSLALAATASSGLPLSYTSSTTSVCTISGSMASFVASGTCSITASQSGNKTYAPATASQSFTVGSQSQQSVNLSAVYNIYAIANSGTAPANGGLDTASYAYAENLLGNSVTWAGSTFALGQAGVADAVSSTKIPLPAGQFSSVQILATAAFGNQTNQPFLLTYSDGTTSAYVQSVSDWGSPQGFAGESIALAMPYRVTPTGGTQAVVTWNLYAYTIPVSSGKTVVSLTPPNNRSIVVLAVSVSSNSLTAQSIAFGAIANYTVGTNLTLTATASSGLALTYTSSTASVCTVSGSTLALIGAGTCTVTASQAGNTTYAPATSVSQSFTVSSAAQTPQNITFGTIASYPVGTTLTLTATASSGLAVIYVSSTSAVCSVSGSSLSLISAGTCTVTASQSGNTTFAPAPSVSQSFTVTQTAAAGYDVFLLAGQSNMLGYGTGVDSAVDAAVNPRISEWDNVTNTIIPAVDPLYAYQGELGTVGPGVSFAKAYLASIASNRKVLLVNAALGGSGFWNGFWQAPSGSGATTAVQYANAAMAAAGPGARFAGILWHQGEADIIYSGAAAYETNLTTLIAYLRANITGATGTTPFVVGEMTPAWIAYNLSTTPSYAPAQYTIMQDLRTIPDTVSNAAWTSSELLQGDLINANIHFSVSSQRTFGRRYYEKFVQASNGLPQPETSLRTWDGAFYDDGRGLLSLSTLPVNNPPTVSGTVYPAIDPVRGNVAQISQAQGYLSVTVPATTFNGSYTKMAWFKPGATGYYNNLISASNPGQTHFLLAQTLSPASISIAAGHSSGGVSINVSATATAPSSGWMNIAVVYSAATQTMTLYANGLQVASQANIAPAPASTSSSATLPVFLGTFTASGGGMDGEMAGNRIWTSALTAAQIAGIYNFELLTTPSILMFGSVAPTSPATQSYTYSPSSGAALTSISVLTDGISGGDYSLGNGTTCATGVGASCIVNVTFTPRSGGLRRGALVLTDSNGAQTNVFLSGVGSITPAYNSPVQSVVASGLGSPSGVAVDGAGNIYTANAASNTVTEFNSSGTLVRVVGGVSSPSGVTVDASGTIYVAASGTQNVLKVLPGSSTLIPVATAFTSSTTPMGMAADGLGNVYVANPGSNYIHQISPSEQIQTVNTGSLTLAGAAGLAVDAAGNLFIADSGNGRIVKVPASGGAYSSVFATGFQNPTGVAVDAAGNLFVVDSKANTLYQIAAGSTTHTSLATGFNANYGVAVGADGSIYVADSGNGRVVKYQRSVVSSQTITFGAIAAQKIGTTLQLTATASSGLTVSYVSTTASICTISGGAASLVAAGTCTMTASQSGNGSYAPAASVSQSFTVGSASSPVQISLSSVANIYAISNVGTAPANGGLDNASYAYAGGLIGSSVTWSGTTFAIGKAGVADAVTSTRIPVPAGGFSTLKILATAAFGNQVNQQFILTYSDGTTSTYTQSVSDWGSPQSYAGESQALGMAYRVTPTGTQQAVVTWNLYGYSIPVTSGKTVVSLTLPNNRSIVVLAVSGL